MEWGGEERSMDSVTHPALSIVIPAYNEALRIEGTLERVMECITTRGWDAEVIVIDDGSTDETVAVVQRWMERYKRLHLVKNVGNRGKGYSVRNGLLQAAGEIVMFTDADLSTPMEEGERLFAAGLRKARPPSISPSIGASSAAVSTRSPVSSSACPSKTHSAVSRPSNARPPRPSSVSRPSSAGASTRRSSSSPASSSTRSKRSPSPGATTSAAASAI